MPGSDDSLRAVLGAEPPETVSALPEADRTALAELLAEARTRQTESMVTTFDATLRHVPSPFRRIVKKVLLG